MITINLKQGGHLCVEPFDDHEEEDRCKIYDEYGNYLDYIDVSYEEEMAKAHYDSMILFFTEMEDVLNYIDCLFRRYTWGHSLQELIDNIADDKAHEYTPEELQEELDILYEYLEQNGEQKFCTEYMINKIGDLYVCGND